MSKNKEKNQKKNNGKVLWIIVSIIILVALIGFFVWLGVTHGNKNNDVSNSDLVSKTDVVSQTDNAEVSFQMTVSVDGTQILFDKELKAKAGQSLMDVMKENITDNGGIVEDNGFITSICGVSQDAGANKYWMYTVNGEYAPVGAAEYKLAEGDKVVFDLQVVNY